MGCTKMFAFAGEDRVIYYEGAICGVGRHDTGIGDSLRKYAQTIWCALKAI